MEKVICAIAKCEELYIKDWVEYHLNQGWDHIYVFDNSDIENRAHWNYYKNDKLTYLPMIGWHKERLQFIAYNEFYNNFSFDWCAFIDLDEYIVLDRPLDAFILSFPADCDCIKLNWHIYGDDGLIERDVNVPIIEGIVDRRKNHSYEKNGKMILKKGLDINIQSSHWTPNVQAYQADYKLNNGKLFEYRNCENCFINHYITKTLSEFINQKLNRTDVVFKDRKLDFGYFWVINKHTPEKEEYIKKNCK